MTRFERVFVRQKPVLAGRVDVVSTANRDTMAGFISRLRDRITPVHSWTGNP